MLLNDWMVVTLTEQIKVINILHLCCKILYIHNIHLHVCLFLQYEVQANALPPAHYSYGDADQQYDANYG